MTGFVGTMTELNTYAERLIHTMLKKGTIPKLGAIRSNTTLQTLDLPLINAKDPTSVFTNSKPCTWADTYSNPGNSTKAQCLHRKHIRSINDHDREDAK